MQLYKKKTNLWHDKRILPRCFDLGEQVLLYNSRLKLFPGKVRSQWSEHFKVVEVFPRGAIEVENEQDNHWFKVNGHRLKQYIGVEVVLP